MTNKHTILQLFQVQYVYRNDPEFLRTYVVGLHNRYINNIIYYRTALRRVQITLKTSTDITRYLYSRTPVRQVSFH